MVHLENAISDAISRLGFTLQQPRVALITSSKTELVVVGENPVVEEAPRKSWLLNYTVISFLMNGQLYAEYTRLAHILVLPACSDSQWQRIVVWVGEHVEKFADVLCQQVREMVEHRGDKTQWVASYDGFYLTKGHYSNNCSATLHDYFTGAIAWYQHRTKTGLGHNWEGTSSAAEGDMLN